MNQNGIIINNPFENNISTSFLINETNVTNFTDADWLRIKDRTTENSTLVLNNQKTEVVRAFIDTYIPNVHNFTINVLEMTKVYFILIFCIQVSEFQKEINEIQDLMQETFIYLTIYDITLSIASVLAAVIASSILVNKLVEPLIKLTLYAKAVNQTTHARDENKKLLRKINFDIDQLAVIFSILKFI